jgi:mRNA-degrading endonuclease RelE of RelBE toxin-antitoxin system
MPWDLVITKPAVRDLKELSRDDLRRVNKAFEAMRADPYSGDIKFSARRRRPAAPTDRCMAHLFQGGAKIKISW